VYQFGRTRGTVRSTGTPFDIPEVHRWIVRDARAIEAHFAIDTPAMLTAFEVDECSRRPVDAGNRTGMSMRPVR
jgi:hypothetical protein